MWYCVAQLQSPPPPPERWLHSSPPPLKNEVDFPLGKLVICIVLFSLRLKCHILISLHMTRDYRIYLYVHLDILQYGRHFAYTHLEISLKLLWRKGEKYLKLNNNQTF